MNPQIALLERASELLNIAQEAQAVLRILESNSPRSDCLYAWIRNACLVSFDVESEALADQYRDVLNQTDEKING